MLKQVLVLFFLVASVFAETAYFAFEYPGTKDPEFIVEFIDDDNIKHARDLLSGAATNKPHISGVIRKNTTTYNPQYIYYIDPFTVSFFDYLSESCTYSFRGAETYIEDVCGEFMHSCIFCPWDSKIVREVKL